MIDAAIAGQAQILVISVFADKAHVILAFEAGACGYLLKDAGPEELTQALANLRSGGAPISSAVAVHLLRRMRATSPSLSSRGHLGDQARASIARAMRVIGSQPSA